MSSIEFSRFFAKSILPLEIFAITNLSKSDIELSIISYIFLVDTGGQKMCWHLDLIVSIIFE